MVGTRRSSFLPSTRMTALYAAISIHSSAPSFFCPARPTLQLLPIPDLVRCCTIIIAVDSSEQSRLAAFSLVPLLEGCPISRPFYQLSEPLTASKRFFICFGIPVQLIPRVAGKSCTIGETLRLLRSLVHLSRLDFARCLKG